MRDLMPALANIDISAANIAAYTGNEGTAPNDADMVPARIKKLERQTVPDEIETMGESAVRAVKSADITYPANEIPEDAFTVMRMMEKQFLHQLHCQPHW